MNINCDACHQKFSCIFYDSYGFNYCCDCVCSICLEYRALTRKSFSIGACKACRKLQEKIIYLYSINLNLSHDIEDLIYKFL